MTLESIIGITSGIIGIILAIIGFVREGIPWIKEKCNGPSPQKLFAKLMDKKMSDAERKKILEILNKSSLINQRIKEEYIQNFTLGKRGKETVLFDLCDSNDIEPTDDICKGLIGVSMPSHMKAYKEIRSKGKVIVSKDNN